MYDGGGADRHSQRRSEKGSSGAQSDSESVGNGGLVAWLTSQFGYILNQTYLLIAQAYCAQLGYVLTLDDIDPYGKCGP